MELKDVRDCGSFFLPAAPAAPLSLQGCRERERYWPGGLWALNRSTGNRIQLREETVKTLPRQAPANRTPTWWGWLAEHLEQ